MILKIFKDLTEKKLKKEYQIRCSYKYEYKKLNIICFIITTKQYIKTRYVIIYLSYYL